MLGNFASYFCPLENRRSKININLSGIECQNSFNPDQAQYSLDLILCQNCFFFHASSDFCNLLTITFANSLDPYKNQQNVSPDLNSNFLTL